MTLMEKKIRMMKVYGLNKKVDVFQNTSIHSLNPSKKVSYFLLYF